MTKSICEDALRTWEQAVVEFRSEPNNDKLVRDAFYDDPLLSAADRYRSSAEWRAVRELLPARKLRVLEVGAGRGIASFAFAKDGHAVVALEPDPSAVVGAAAIRQLSLDGGLNIEVLQTSSENLPVPDRAFDVVFARAVLHHIPDLNAACSEVFRVLRPGGLFIALREHVISKDQDLDAFHRAHPLHWRYGGEMAFRLEYYLESLRRAGFEKINTLAPLANDVNIFPHSKRSFLQALVRRMRVGVLEQAVASCSEPMLDWLWSALVLLGPLFDNRPGRLYSFVAVKD